MARFRRFRPLPKLFWLSALVMFLAVGVVLVQQRQIINSDAASNGCKLCLKNVDNPKECDSLCKPKYGGCKYDKDCKEGFACKGTVCKPKDDKTSKNPTPKPLPIKTPNPTSPTTSPSSGGGGINQSNLKKYPQCEFDKGLLDCTNLSVIGANVCVNSYGAKMRCCPVGMHIDRTYSRWNVRYCVSD